MRKNNKIGFTDDGNIKTFGVPLGKIAARVKTNKKDSVLVKQHLSNNNALKRKKLGSFLPASIFF